MLTEAGVLHKMQKASPNSKFYGVGSIDESGCSLCNTCPYMKLNTLEKVYLCMLNRAPVIKLEENIRISAKNSLQKMLDMSLSIPTKNN